MVIVSCKNCHNFITKRFYNIKSIGSLIEDVVSCPEILQTHTDKQETLLQLPSAPPMRAQVNYKHASVVFV